MAECFKVLSKSTLNRVLELADDLSSVSQTQEDYFNCKVYLRLFHRSNFYEGCLVFLASDYLDEGL